MTGGAHGQSAPIFVFALTRNARTPEPLRCGASHVTLGFV